MDEQQKSFRALLSFLVCALLLLIWGLLFLGDSFVGACLQAMVRGVLATYRQQAGSHKVYGTWLLVLCYYCWLFCGSLPASDDLWTTKARIASRLAPTG